MAEQKKEMSKKEREEKYDKIFDEICKSNSYIPKNKLGSGGFGLVKEILFIDNKNSSKNKIYAGKLTERKEKSKYNENDIILEFKGPNILKVNSILPPFERDNVKYDFIVMEKARLKDLKTLQSFLHRKNILKLIFKKPFESIIGDNFIRYFLMNVLRGFECLDRSDFTHFDIKPENILICLDLIFKISDFGLLRSPKQIAINNNENQLRIPGGTQGYLTPEFYSEKYVSKDNIKKQDYFALGATIFFLKYGNRMLDYKENLDDKIRNADNIIELLEIAMDEIKTTKGCDKGFIEFLCNLIQYKPEDRPIFEEIYRNKWLHKNSEEISKIIDNNYYEEEKLMLELNKSDFLLERKEYLDKIKNQNNNNNINNNNNNNQRFKFKFNNEIIKKKE